METKLNFQVLLFFLYKKRDEQEQEKWSYLSSMNEMKKII